MIESNEAIPINDDNPLEELDQAEPGEPRWAEEPLSEIILGRWLDRGLKSNVFEVQVVMPNGEKCPVAAKIAPLEALCAEADTVELVREKYTELYPGEPVPLVTYRLINAGDSTSTIPIAADTDYNLEKAIEFCTNIKAVNIETKEDLAGSAILLMNCLTRDLYHRVYSLGGNEGGLGIEDIYATFLKQAIKLVIASIKAGIATADWKSNHFYLSKDSYELKIIDWNTVINKESDPGGRFNRAAMMMMAATICFFAEGDTGNDLFARTDISSELRQKVTDLQKKSENKLGETITDEEVEERLKLLEELL